MKNHTFVITAAGGNGTAIEVLEHSLSRAEYAQRGGELMHDAEDYHFEQCGFLILDDNHFEMAGGEFCGNATRSAAILFYRLNGEPEFEFTVSGFSGQVKATVKPLSANRYDVTCTFPGLEAKTTQVKALGHDATLVDLGGIVHVVIEDDFPQDESQYTADHHQITEDLNLTDRDAVGVCWIKRSDNKVTMHPVVWVPKGEKETFYYESSCGSGTIAVGKVAGVDSVVQPTGQTIDVHFTDNSVELHSEMEITHEHKHH